MNNFTLRSALLFLALALTLQGAWAKQTTAPRYRNIVNTKWATVSDGPQSSVLIDVDTNTPDAQEQAVIKRSLQAQWRAQAQVVGPQIAALQKAGFLRGRGTLPISTLISVRRGGRLVVPPLSRTRAIGGGNLTFIYTGFNSTDQAFLQQFVSLAYPRIVALYGQPSWSGQVEIVNAGTLDTSTISQVQRLAFGGYDSANARIYLPIFDNVDSFAHALLLNMVHAFHGPAVFQYDAWEQGFARAAAAVVARDPVFGFQDVTANYLYSLLPFYDLLNQAPLANSTFFPPSQANLTLQGQTTIGKMLLPRAGMSGAAWLKVYIENQGFFRQFNAAYYAQLDPAAPGKLAGNVPVLRQIAAPLLPNGVEGLPWDAWFERQYILDSSVSVGNKLYAFVVPFANDATNGQSASVTLVYFRGETTGDETLLSGQAYSTYFDSTNARVNLGIAAETATIAAGEGAISTLTFPTTGFDTGRITMDFRAGNSSVRSYIASGFAGDFQGVVLGPNAKGSLTVTETTIPPINVRTATANTKTTYNNSAFGVGLGVQANDLAVTTVQYNDGSGSPETYRFNTGDGQYYAIVRRGSLGGGVVTLQRTFAASPTPYLVSFPLQPLQGAVENALGLLPQDFLLSYWDPNRPAYETVVPGQPSVARIQPGRGYWLKLEPGGASANPVVSVTGVPPATDTDFTVGCVYGWNLIGAPFSQSIDTSRILVQHLQNDAISWNDAVNISLIAAKPFAWDAANGTFSQTTAIDGTTWQGYFVRVLVPDGVTLLLPGPDSPTTRAVNPLRLVGRASIAAPARPKWSVHLQAQQNVAGTTRAARATLGAASKSGPGFDNRYDLESPPPVVASLSVHFPHNDWGRAAGGRYVSDYRDLTRAAGSGATWNVSVETPANGPVTLTWDGVGEVDRSTRLTLVDTITGSRVALRSRSSYTFTGAAGQTRALQIVAEPARSLPLMITTVNVVSGRAVGGGRGGVNISYTLTDDAQTTVEMTTIGGRSIRTLAGGRAVGATGRAQTAHWDGRAQNGAPVPPGLYNLTITARADDGTVVRQTRPVMMLQ